MASVSLVIPCYNYGAILPRAVVSALKQDFLHELIIVDDHSTDGSLDTAQQLARGDHRIRCVRTECNQGPGAARNLGARLATGEYLSFLDADDELLDGFFEAAVGVLQSRPDMHLVKAEMEFFDPVKGYILPSYDPRYSAVVLSSSCGLVIRRTAFEMVGGFPESSVFRGPHGGEDVAFMNALIKFLQPIGRIEKPGYRCWSCAGSHLDRFLANTRLKGDSFEFVRIHPDQAPDGALARSIDEYLARVAIRFSVN